MRLYVYRGSLRHFFVSAVSQRAKDLLECPRITSPSQYSTWLEDRGCLGQYNNARSRRDEQECKSCHDLGERPLSILFLLPIHTSYTCVGIHPHNPILCPSDYHIPIIKSYENIPRYSFRDLTNERVPPVYLYAPCCEQSLYASYSRRYAPMHVSCWFAPSLNCEVVVILSFLYIINAV